MPFHFHPDSVNFNFCEEIINVLLKIDIDTQGVAITPRVFLAEIKLHLFPLLPSKHQDVVAVLRNPTWDDLYFVFVELAARSGGNDRLLEEVALAIKLLYTSSLSSRREFEFPSFLEITYFLQMQDHAKKPVRHLCQLDQQGNSAVFLFCQYCWRLALPNKRLCYLHRVHSGSTNSAVYKEAYRQKTKFDENIKSLLTAELLEFHDSGLTADVLFPDSNICNWLRRRRPLCWNQIEGVTCKVSDSDVVETLLVKFHRPEDEAFSVSEFYKTHNEFILNHPELIWPMLLRAEAWLQVRSDVKKAWGGAREK